MLKKELEEKLREAEQTVNHIRGVITEVSRRALENNCSEAIGYVAEIDGVLETSWELTYKGKVIPFDIEQFDIAEY